MPRVLNGETQLVAFASTMVATAIENDESLDKLREGPDTFREYGGRSSVLPTEPVMLEPISDTHDEGAGPHVAGRCGEPMKYDIN